MKGVRIFVNNRLIETVDPLYLNPKARHSGATPYGPPIKIAIPVVDPDLVEKGEAEERIPKVDVEVHLSRLPASWMGDESKVNRNQRRIYERCQMSVLRPDRELELAFRKIFNVGDEDSDNWWGGEIHIPASPFLAQVCNGWRRSRPGPACGEDVAGQFGGTRKLEAGLASGSDRGI